MGNTRSSEHSSIDWLAKEPLAPHIDAYMQFLADRDYAANTFSCCRRRKSVEIWRREMAA